MRKYNSIIRGAVVAKVAENAPSGLMPEIVAKLKKLTARELKELVTLSEMEILKRISIEPHEAR